MAFFSIFWDLDDDPRGNVVHCKRNHLSVDEISEVLQNATDTDFSNSTGNPVVFGDTSTGKHVMVVYEDVPPDSAYPITAYVVPKKV